METELKSRISDSISKHYGKPIAYWCLLPVATLASIHTIIKPLVVAICLYTIFYTGGLDALREYVCVATDVSSAKLCNLMGWMTEGWNSVAVFLICWYSLKG